MSARIHPGARKPEARAPEAKTGLNLCSLAAQLKDSQKKLPQNSTQGKCLLKFLVSPLFCKAGGSEIRNLVKVKETSKKKFPQQNLSNWALQSERGPAAKRLPLGCSKLRPSSWTSQLNRLGLFRGTANAASTELKPETEHSQRSSKQHRVQDSVRLQTLRWAGNKVQIQTQLMWPLRKLQVVSQWGQAENF